MLKFQLAEIILTRFPIFYFQKKQRQNHGILGSSKNKYLPGLFLGTYSAWLSHSLHFLTDLEEQKDDSDDLQSPVTKEAHLFYLLCTYEKRINC